MKLVTRKLATFISALIFAACGSNSSDPQENPNQTVTGSNTAQTKSGAAEQQGSQTTIVQALKDNGVDYKFFSLGACVITQKAAGEKPTAECEVTEVEKEGEAVDLSLVDIAAFRAEPRDDDTALGLICIETEPGGCDDWRDTWVGGGANPKETQNDNADNEENNLGICPANKGHKNGGQNRLEDMLADALRRYQEGDPYAKVEYAELHERLRKAKRATQHVGAGEGLAQIGYGEDTADGAGDQTTYEYNRAYTEDPYGGDGMYTLKE